MPGGPVRSGPVERYADLRVDMAAVARETQQWLV
jgi:hypothetical protein